MNLILHTAESLKGGFAFSINHPGRWILYTVLMLIPIVNLFAAGALLKIYRGEEASLERPGRCFLEGLLAVLINTVYMIIPIVITSVFIISGITVGLEYGDFTQFLTGFLLGSGLGIGIGIIPFILFSMIALPAIINFVRSKKLLSAFNFYEIFDMIRGLGLGKYILAWVVIVIFYVILSLVEGALYLIPVCGDIIMIVVWAVLLVPVAVFNNIFWNKLL
jgi:hypothetical protein